MSDNIFIWYFKLNYLKLSLSYRLFIWYLHYFSIFTFIQMYLMINET